jgi:hypothetical protein
MDDGDISAAQGGDIEVIDSTSVRAHHHAATTKARTDNCLD